MIVIMFSVCFYSQKLVQYTVLQIPYNCVLTITIFTPYAFTTSYSFHLSVQPLTASFNLQECWEYFHRILKTSLY